MRGKDEDRAAIRRRQPPQLGNDRKTIGLGERQITDKKDGGAARLEHSGRSDTVTHEHRLDREALNSLTVNRRLLWVEFSDENVSGHL
jgi:hypothetical protein